MPAVDPHSRPSGSGAQFSITSSVGSGSCRSTKSLEVADDPAPIPTSGSDGGVPAHAASIMDAGGRERHAASTEEQPSHFTHFSSPSRLESGRRRCTAGRWNRQRSPTSSPENPRSFLISLRCLMNQRNAIAARPSSS